MASGAKRTLVDGEAMFAGPGTTNAVSGGTAAFYKVELKEPHPVTKRYCFLLLSQGLGTRVPESCVC